LKVNRFWTLACFAVLTFGASAVPKPASSQSPRTHLYDRHADARADIAAALSRAYSSHRLVLLEFGANWCPACHSLAALFEDPKVRSFLRDHFEVVRIDVGDFDRNRDVSRKYAMQGSIPSAAVLDSAGEVIAVMQGGLLARDESARELLTDLERWVAATP
jgi:thiol:disulfide interchange protein